MENPSSHDPKKEQLQFTPQEKALFSQFAIHLSRAFIQTHNFGTEHMYAKEAFQQAFGILKNILKDKEEISLFIAEGKLKYNFIPLEEKNFLVQKLVELFSKTRLVSIRFKKDVTESDFKKLLGIFHAKPEDILAAGGVEEEAKKLSITAIEINPVKYELIGKDEKIIAGDGQVFDVEEGGDVFQDTGDIVAEKEEEKEERPEEQLLRLIDEVLKEETTSSSFLDKIKENPGQVANCLIEAIKIIDRVGMDMSESFVSSMMEKLIYVKNALSASIEDDKIHPYSKEINTFLVQMEKQLKPLKVSEGTQAFFKEVTNLNVEVADRLKAASVIIGVSKEKVTLSMKGKIAQSIAQRKKVSESYEPLIKELLSKRNFSDEEINQIIEEGTGVLGEKKKKKMEALSDKIAPILDKISKQDISGNPLAKEELSKTISKVVDDKVKFEIQEALNEKIELEETVQRIEKVLGELTDGVVVLGKDRKIIFINEPAKEILKLWHGEEKDEIEESTLEIVKSWTPDKKEGLSEETARFFSSIKYVNKNAQGDVESIILKKE
jgi:PAS domain-containing protein